MENIIDREIKVIRIISDTEVIIDIGFNGEKNGWFLAIDDTIPVYGLSDPIKDLEGNNLGIAKYYKGNIRIKEIYDNFSICSIKNIQSVYSFPNITYKEAENKLNIDKNDITPLKTNDKDTIKVGDIVEIAKG